MSTKKQVPLGAVTRAATRATRARQELEEAIRRVPADVSLRRIAEAAGLSHEQVRRVRQQQPKGK